MALDDGLLATGGGRCGAGERERRLSPHVDLAVESRLTARCTVICAAPNDDDEASEGLRRGEGGGVASGVVAGERVRGERERKKSDVLARLRILGAARCAWTSATEGTSLDEEDVVADAGECEK